MRRIAIAICVATLFTFVMITSSPLTGASAQKNSYKYRPVDQPEQSVPGRVLVKFREHIMPDHARNIIAGLGARDADEILGLGVHILDLPEQADEAGFAQAMAQRPEVEFAELDKMVAPAEMTPNDPWYVDQWHLKKIGAPSAWAATTGSANVIIAILDTGVEGTHPDLAPNMVPGWNIYNNNSDTRDVVGHGTSVAGTAVAASNNNNGVASVAWGCKIMPIRISDLSGYAPFSNMAAGLTWAADHGARVANLSYGATNSSTVKSAAQYFQSKGGVVTMSSGNQGSADSSPDNPYVLTVGATDKNDVLAQFSNTGNNIDLSAPGTTIRTTAMNGTYQAVAGTSVSAPIVAGVAALVISANPSLTAPQIQDAITQSADDLGPTGWDPAYGWGRVNAARAVAMAGGNSVDINSPIVSIIAPIGGAIVSGTITVGISASDNVAVASVSLGIDGVSCGTDIPSPYGFQWDTTTIANGVHTVIASASDAAGNSASYSVIVTVSNSALPLDTAPPTDVIKSPSDGTKLAANVSVYVDATDNVGVVRNELYVDGVLVSSSNATPFTTKWNTRKANAGLHTLQCKAYDAAGNVGISQLVSVYK